MNYGNILPVTGGAGAFILGRYLGLDDIIGVAIVAVLFGIAAYRFGSRLGNHRTTKTITAVAAAAAAAVGGHLAGLSWPDALVAALTITAAVLWALAATAQRGAHAAV